jgi:hypothetical protein
MKSFCRFFKSKTGNDWKEICTGTEFIRCCICSCHNILFPHILKSYRGRHTMLERDYSDKTGAAADRGGGAAAREKATELVAQKKQPRRGRGGAGDTAQQLECSCPPSVQTLLMTICSIAMMKATLLEMGAPSSRTPQPAAPRHRTFLAIRSNHVSAGPDYDSVKCPLGKLSHSVIKSGMAVLRQIEAKISKDAGPSSLADLSSQFYTFIPHVSGMSAPPIISDLEAVASKVEFLMCLLDATVAMRKMEASEQAETGMHPLDHVYSCLSCSIQPIESGLTLNMLRDYLVTSPHSFTVFLRPCFKPFFALISRQLTAQHIKNGDWRFKLHIPSANSKKICASSHTSSIATVVCYGFTPPSPLPPPPLTCYSFRHGSRTSNVTLHALHARMLPLTTRCCFAVHGYPFSRIENSAAGVTEHRLHV